MSKNVQQFDNRSDLYAGVFEVICSKLDAVKPPVVLMSEGCRINEFRDYLLARGGSSSVRIETPRSWVSDRWELFGDGRRVITPLERSLLLRRICNDSGICAGAVSATGGVINILAKLAQEALPEFLCVDQSDSISRELTDAEKWALLVLHQYSKLLSQLSLCEESQILALLPTLINTDDSLVLMDCEQETYAYAQFFEQLSSTRSIYALSGLCEKPSAFPNRSYELESLLGGLFGRNAQECVTATGDVRFLLPSGRYATPALLCQEIYLAVVAERKRSRDQKTEFLPVYVSSHDPFVMFNGIAKSLASEGIPSSTYTQKLFSETSFGRVFFSLLTFLFEEGASASHLSDFVSSPFSDLTQRKGYELDAAWRKKRIIDRQDLIEELSSLSPAMSEVLENLRSQNYEPVLRYFERVASSKCSHRVETKSEHLAAISCVRKVVRGCEDMGLSFLDGCDTLKNMPVSFTAGIDLKQDSENEFVSEVIFTTLSKVSSLSECSVSTLFLCDLDSASYPVRQVEDWADRFLVKTVGGLQSDVLERARREFFSALSSARSCVVLHRVLHTEEACESYPCAMYEELVDCYLSSHSKAKDIDRSTGLPLTLLPYALVAGEDKVSENVGLSLGSSCLKGNNTDSRISWPRANRGTVSDEMKARVVVSGRSVDGSSRIVLSASALESYLECPYKWFINRRINPVDIDAEWGPLEKGSFTHGVLKDFYLRFAEDTFGKKVNKESLKVAQDILVEVFEDNLEAQKELPSSSNPLIARGKLEELEVSRLRESLVRFLNREVDLLPGFTPTYFELNFGYDTPFQYGGFDFRGCIDRVDVNEQGQAVIIDYKGSLSKEYALASSGAVGLDEYNILPHKVQTLMYAQALRKIKGLDVVGALYVSYGAHGGIAGSFDNSVLGPHDLPGVDSEACGVYGSLAQLYNVSCFHELLDTIESRICKVSKSLLGGSIEPLPRDKNACNYCLAHSCKKRIVS